MDEIGTCGSCDYDARGYVHHCRQPAPYRAEYRRRELLGRTYPVPVCARHANDARTDRNLQRIYSAGHDHRGTAD